MCPAEQGKFILCRACGGESPPVLYVARPDTVLTDKSRLYLCKKEAG